MHQVAKARGVAGLCAVVAGVALIGADGAAFVAGWALWAVGLGSLLTAIPSAGGEDQLRRYADWLPIPGRPPNAPPRS